MKGRGAEWLFFLLLTLRLVGKFIYLDGSSDGVGTHFFRIPWTETWQLWDLPGFQHQMSGFGDQRTAAATSGDSTVGRLGPQPVSNSNQSHVCVCSFCQLRSLENPGKSAGSSVRLFFILMVECGWATLCLCLRPSTHTLLIISQPTHPSISHAHRSTCPSTAVSTRTLSHVEPRSLTGRN